MAEVKLIADSGGGTVALKAPASTTSNAALVLKLPVADGTNGQAVTTNGSGQLAFGDVASAVADGCIYENDLTISNNYTIAATKGAHSVGPITNNAVVTLNGVWVIS